MKRLREGTADPDTLTDTLAEASNAIEDAEQRSLTEYVVRRKVVLDFVEVLLEKVRDDTRDSSYQREEILHSFICPLQVNTIGSRQIEPAASHDLWIVDERLTFAQYFSSDVAFSVLSEKAESRERPDVLIFDRVHGLQQANDFSKVLLIEFKRPGRNVYKDSDNPQFQVEGYVKKLQGGGVVDWKGRPIPLDENTIFYCYIVADIVGKMDEWTFTWQRTVDDRGRIYQPNSGFRGSIELMSWDRLIDDAKARNRAFFDKAGITGESFFSTRAPA